MVLLPDQIYTGVNIIVCSSKNRTEYRNEFVICGFSPDNKRQFFAPRNKKEEINNHLFIKEHKRMLISPSLFNSSFTLILSATTPWTLTKGSRNHGIKYQYEAAIYFVSRITSPFVLFPRTNLEDDSSLNALRAFGTMYKGWINFLLWID